VERNAAFPFIGRPARCRPHHVLPTYWPVLVLAGAALFLVAVAIRNLLTDQTKSD
jgi:hypothetical protein